MTDSTYSTLALRLRAPRPEKPDTYPVEATINDSGSINASMTLQPGSLTALESDPWEYGRRLGHALFGEGPMQRALAYARAGEKQVSLSLEIDPEAVGLHDLMWEHVIQFTGNEEIPLAASSTFAFSRRIPLELPPLTSSEGPFRMLLFISSPLELEKPPDGAASRPGELAAINVAAEVTSLREAWDSLVERGLMRVSVLGRLEPTLVAGLESAGYSVFMQPATLNALADRLSSVDGLHLISHGAFKDNRASLLLENNDGRMERVAEEDFLAKFGDRSLRLVFLQACQSATRTPGMPNAMSGLAPKVARRSAGVVAMQDVVRMDDARRFAQQFYGTLLSKGLADAAANAGRRALYRPDSRNWAIPALYLTPKAEQLWEPDAVLRAVQDLAEQFKGKPDVKNPFPIDVIRQWPDVSSQMETSPPGPRVRVLEAITSTLFPDATEGKRSPIVVIAGNYGRAKTAQLYLTYVHHAGQVSRREIVPFFAQVSDFQSADDTPERTLAAAIAVAYRRLGIELGADLLERRLRQPFILCLDGDQEADSRKRAIAFECLQALTQSNAGASAVITLDEQLVGQTAALKGRDGEDPIPVLLVQLLSPATVTQYLTSSGANYKPLLASLQRANLFDLAGVPWLLSHLTRHANRGGLSRSGVIDRIVTGNFAAATVPAGVRRIVNDVLARMAWTLQTRQALRLDGGRVYEILDQVRGRREVQLEQLKTYALDTKIVAAVDEDAIRFSYPGFQSFWCARYLVESGSALNSHLDDITATLGRRSRVRHWEDTLVLLAGMIDVPERLVARILAGSSMSSGEQAFLAARCIHEAKLAGRTVGRRVVEQVLDTLVWRSTPMKESRASVRVRATECLALLKEPASVPHLVSLAIERVRPTFNAAQPTFELSGLRHAALQVLLTMQDETDAYISAGEADGPVTPTHQAIKTLIQLWRQGDGAGLREMFRSTTIEGLPAVIAFVLGTSGGDENLAFLTEALLDRDAAEDAQWSVVDSLLFFDPGEVTRRAVTRLREDPALYTQAAYMIGRLRVAKPGSDECRFLVSCLGSESARTRGVALKALAQLGITDYKRHCELMATDSWDKLTRSKDRLPGVAPQKRADERMTLRTYALESLRLIGDEDSIKALRDARELRSNGTADRRGSQLMQLSYEVSEDIYWRISGGREGDFYDPVERPSPAASK